MAKKKREPEQKKRSLLSSLFEPADGSETDGLFDEPDFGDDELVHLFDDDDVEYSEEQDEAALSGLTWSDGERVVEIADIAEQESLARSSRPKPQKDEAPEDEPTARRKRSAGYKGSAGAGSPHRVARIPSAAEADDQIEPREPLVEQAPDKQPPAADGSATPGTLDAAAFLARNAEPGRNAASYLMEGAIPEAEPISQADQRLSELEAGRPPVSSTTLPPRTAAQAPAPPQQEQAETVPHRDAAGAAQADAPPIRLFDEEERPRRGSRTRMFRTGGSTAARINMNETETSRSIDEAKRRQREKDAQRQHEEYVQRQKKRKRRRYTVKRMAANVAFVAFIVIAVLVALYYTFLLKNIVVSGNETYSDEYIVGLTGLQYGTHMLLCDLDAARTGIEQDPYLQVDAVDYIFPARVRIQVTERKEVAGIIGLDYNIIIDHNGYVLSMGGGTDLSGLLQVTGVSMTGFQVGQRLGQTDDFGTATLVTMINKLEEYLLIDDIASLDLTTPLAIVMYAKNGLKIHVGQPTDLAEKMLSLHKNLPQFVSAGINKGTLYLSARGGTVYSPTNAGTVTPTDPDNPTDPNNPTDPTDPGGTDPNAPPSPGTATPSPTDAPLQPGGGDGFQG